MNLVGYLITLANLQNFQGVGGPLKDLSIRVSPVETLLSELKSHPEFQIEKFKKTGYSRVGNVGKYLSNKVLNYIFKKNVDPRDEGVILTLNFAENIAVGDPSNNANVLSSVSSSVTPSGSGETLSYFIHKGKMSNDVREGINEYLDGVINKRDRRSLLARLKK